MIGNKAGFSLAEVLVAVVLLSVGLMAVASGSGSVYQMLGAGKRATRAATLATERMEALRRQANSTNPRCTTLAGGSAVRGGGMIETWTVAGSGSTRTLRVWVRYPTSRGVTADTMFTILSCG